MLGVPLATALAGTLLLRGFTLWLPLIPGFLLLRSSLRQARKRPAKHEVTSKFLPNREKANLQ
jgi:glycosyltransferase 2 family protein